MSYSAVNKEVLPPQEGIAGKERMVESLPQIGILTLVGPNGEEQDTALYVDLVLDTVVAVKSGPQRQLLQEVAPLAPLMRAFDRHGAKRTADRLRAGIADVTGMPLAVVGPEARFVDLGKRSPQALFLYQITGLRLPYGMPVASRAERTRVIPKEPTPWQTVAWPQGMGRRPNHLGKATRVAALVGVLAFGGAAVAPVAADLAAQGSREVAQVLETAQKQTEGFFHRHPEYAWLQRASRVVIDGTTGELYGFADKAENRFVAFAQDPQGGTLSPEIMGAGAAPEGSDQVYTSMRIGYGGTDKAGNDWRGPDRYTYFYLQANRGSGRTTPHFDQTPGRQGNFYFAGRYFEQVRDGQNRWTGRFREAPPPDRRLAGPRQNYIMMMSNNPDQVPNPQIAPERWRDTITRAVYPPAEFSEVHVGFEKQLARDEMLTQIQSLAATRGITVVVNPENLDVLEAAYQPLGGYDKARAILGQFPEIGGADVVIDRTTGKIQVFPPALPPEVGKALKALEQSGSWNPQGQQLSRSANGELIILEQHEGKLVQRGVVAQDGQVVWMTAAGGEPGVWEEIDRAVSGDPKQWLSAAEIRVFNTKLQTVGMPQATPSAEKGVSPRPLFYMPLAEQELKPIVEKAISDNPLVAQLCQELDHEVVVDLWSGREVPAGQGGTAFSPGFATENGEQTLLYLLPVGATTQQLVALGIPGKLPRFQGTPEDLARLALGVVAEEELIHTTANGSQDLSAQALRDLTGGKVEGDGHYRTRGFRIQKMDGGGGVAEEIDIVEEAVTSLAMRHSANRFANVFDPPDSSLHWMALTLLDRVDPEANFAQQALALKRNGDIVGFADLMRSTFEAGLRVHMQEGPDKEAQVKKIAQEMTTAFFATSFGENPDQEYRQISASLGFTFPEKE